MAADSRTVDKALSLLDLFSERRPAIGLSDLSRASGFKKATTLRLVNTLRSHGFVEQDAVSRSYRLGPAVLRLARLREISVPLETAVDDILTSLTRDTGETALASVVSGDTLRVLRQVESPKSNRVIIDPDKPLPYHATASGLAYLAYADASFIQSVLGADLPVYGPSTETSAPHLRATLNRIRTDGHAMVASTFEDGVAGFAAPCFDTSGRICGAVAVALPLARVTATLEHEIAAQVRGAARRMTVAYGGSLPPDLPKT